MSSYVTLNPSLNVAPARTSATSSWPLNRRQRCWAVSSKLVGPVEIDHTPDVAKPSFGLLRCRRRPGDYIHENRLAEIAEVVRKGRSPAVIRPVGLDVLDGTEECSERGPPAHLLPPGRVAAQLSHEPLRDLVLREHEVRPVVGVAKQGDSPVAPGLVGDPT